LGKAPQTSSSQVAAEGIARFTLIFSLGKDKTRLCCSCRVSIHPTPQNGDQLLRVTACAAHPAFQLSGLSSRRRRATALSPEQ